MKRKQFSEEQIIGILKEAEAGAVVTELCRRHGMSSRPERLQGRRGA
jgi:putative transposase